MSRIGVAVIGAGGLNCATAIIGSLGSYFGERPLDIAFYDPDPERLELFTRLAKVCFTFTEATHLLWSTDDPAEALSIAERAILALDVHGARKFLFATGNLSGLEIAPDQATAAALPGMLAGLAEGTPLLSLMPSSMRLPVSSYFRLDWPDHPTEAEILGLPHQVIRWIRGDDFMFDLISRHERSPLKAWLDDVNAATLVSEG